MKLIINTSNLYVGGGVQVSLSFINELKNLSYSNEYHIFLSKAIENQLDKMSFPNNFYFYLIEKSPAKIKSRKSIIKILDNYEKEINPDLVFSVFGPTYWTPKTKHIMGFAIPWVLQHDSTAYSELNLFKWIKMKLWVSYVSYYVKKNASTYIIETKDGKDKMSDVLNVDKSDIYVVGNTYSNVFDKTEFFKESHKDYINLPKKEDNEFRLLLISHNHPHKNIKIINKLLPLLKDIKIKFILTLDEQSYKVLFPDNPKEIINLGSVNLSSCPSLYKQSDAIFLPTLLEVFSATYPEAMKMSKPILTSNYSFAKDICSDSAIYFDPLKPNDIVEKIKLLVNDKNLQVELIKKGNERLNKFETARTRAEKYLDICNKILNK